ncbi:molybdopterin-dependent oxidoreductase [Undibacterium sp. RTI2.1]|uniref:molybdopterin-dependent oxidoreductase n=1 Tax=unclassified Undibacterium TaxID=2630295 RepID=UPI002AB571B6|nr:MULTISPECIES: molybdopterin-dependent oxidoreductase [unclassified Undibacterium]MDY7540128.1 molybdopterin-dependent oxidoreductase [Undibacterium sp. 5I1]MEB0030301.1 molybdopterin-dependent oxidoreductase [Undibacterium sp. RTI2.1]MEB0115419.1 molybdopterin-dependent oxidoreductase [Undibacterium sp. RTI2.2]MEB0230625.1 molybdopterin-dependent oxidoreductase [Undibacterium sp. 10I3]MEB0257055.1 molybdopterin-dependent oxidoreductase [Undibacterium sp. 5I1]
MTNSEPVEWKKTACIICALNCGLEVQTEGPRIIRIRADKMHPVSQGYLCEKAQRMDYYQNGADRISSPMRRSADGSYEAIDWDTAIREIAEKFTEIKRKHGGESILYYGGGGQGNHLGGIYADSTIKALGIEYRSNALAQEKTGEGWVQGKMMGSGVHCDFEHAEVAVFLGKNPWQSHGFARARVILRDMQKDPNRSIIVIDPRKTETSEMADYHLAVKPGTDAWCLMAMAAIIVQDNLAPMEWHAEHTTGYDKIAAELRKISIPKYAQICGVDEDLIRGATRRIVHAKSVSMLEDLGVQMNMHSTLNSYLNRLVWLLTGNYGRQGANNAFVPLLGLSMSGRDQSKKTKNPKTTPQAIPAKPRVGRTSPVTGFKVIMGLIPCNVIPEEILTDHPKRFRAMLIESANPVHSLADSQKMREALRALELSVVLDVAMTETALQADYVLPASSIFEKAEATFFNLEVPKNAFHLRHPLFAPREGTLSEAEIHARLVEALGAVGPAQYGLLRKAAKLGLLPYALAFAWKSMRDKRVARNAPVVLYRTLGEQMTKATAPAAALWGICQMYIRQQPQAAADAGFSGHPVLAANRLFKAIVNSPSGVIYANAEYKHSWQAVRLPDHRINLWIPELLPEIEKLSKGGPAVDMQYPFILSAGERRTETSNTTFRDSSWHKKGSFGTLRISPQDAADLGCQPGDWVRVTTRRGSADAEIELSEGLQSGHVSLPNGLGLDYRRADGVVERKGVSLNELTGVMERDPIAGTPWHKRVAARVERIPVPV